MIEPALYSSEKNDWETPDEFFDYWNRQFNFKMDVCANCNNYKVMPYLTESDNGLESPWLSPAWCNPPYGREQVQWVQKAIYEQQNGVTTVMLLPSRTDTKMFHEYLYNRPMVSIRFIKGRLKFKGAESPAPFPSMIIIFWGYPLEEK